MTAFPARWLRIKEEAKREGLDYGSEPETGALLRTLAASKPGGSLLELGTAIGLGTAVMAGGLLGDLLFGVSPRDPMILSIAALTLLVAAVSANWIPARRAARMNPVTTLKA